ncbi:MAG: XdhC family protein [Steroidobacteraceae bacterium]|nr:XdhC/CoxI family protein [Gammaproteobacteria bacterium]
MIENFFNIRRERGEQMVAAFVIETRGSTYRKPGAFMLFDGAEGRCGLLSGGCLEGDLHDHARALLTSEARCLERSYDSRGSDDPIWGLGLGCEGLMRVLLLKIDATNAYAPVATLLAAAQARRRTAAAIHIGDGRVQCCDADHKHSDATLAHCAAVAGRGGAELEAPWFFIAAERTPRILICGAGPDAEPVCRYAASLGWQVTIVDHRPAYIDTNRFVDAAQISLVELDTLADALPLHDVDAAIVMSHHLIADSRYLAALAQGSMPYVGLLGPAARRERLYAEIGDAASTLRERLRAPIGLDLGGRTPEAIALSIVAEIQAVLHGRNGRPFSAQDHQGTFSPV